MAFNFCVIYKGDQQCSHCSPYLQKKNKEKIQYPVQNFRSLGLVVSDKNSFKVCYFLYIFQYVMRLTNTHHSGEANNDPWGVIWKTVAEVHSTILHTKFQSSDPDSFRQEDVWGVSFILVTIATRVLHRMEFFKKKLVVLHACNILAKFYLDVVWS